jgi:peroxiredoxin
MNMTTIQRWAPTVMLLLGALWIPLTALEADAAAEARAAPFAGFFAPDFSLESATGESVTLSELRGQPVLVNLWASWCGPCRAEMPAMQRIYDRYRDQGFVVLAVNVTNQDRRAAALAFYKDLGLSYPLLFDVDGSVSAAYQLRALPSSFFILPDGRIQEVVIGGPMAEALLTIRVETLLAEAP